VVVVSGLPGGGKSTLMRAAVPARAGVVRIDSQDTRERWERRVPRWLPYGVYRPLVRMAHYARLRAALGSGAAVVVHDCGTQSWVRRWLARDAVRRGRALHLLLLDVTPEDALEGQAARGRGVSGYAFRRHLRAVRRLRAAAEAGRLPRGCASALLLDRGSAQALRAVLFEPLPAAVPMTVTTHVRPVPRTAPATAAPKVPAPAVPPPGRGGRTAGGDRGRDLGERAADGDRTADAARVSGPLQR
ncbi:ATP-binding protein, partial [Streptomyces albus subsp. chlorinus]|uniref:AAA family ATPase n=1 Tax=Streptomyces albus TaxID=1888 RepID=UPI001570DF9D|nr:ATP-binding protein [Streptomyces albus subsp. chlorinus]